MTSGVDQGIVVLGSFVADVSFRAARLPVWGETVMGSGFALGPGGKGSNQAIAAARAGARVQILTKLGDDAFGQLARGTWAEAGVNASLVETVAEPTGAAAILIDQNTGENAIVVVPGACFAFSPEDVDRHAEAIRSASVLLVQQELPLETVERGLLVARHAGVVTILNPAPAPVSGIPAPMLRLADFVIANESEAALLAGRRVSSIEDAEAAARHLLALGARGVVVTLGARGALVCLPDAAPVLVPAFDAGACVETTGAGDAFCGAFAAALVQGRNTVEAARFASVAAGISVTRAGTAASMPKRVEIEEALQRL